MVRIRHEVPLDLYGYVARGVGRGQLREAERARRDQLRRERAEEELRARRLDLQEKQLGQRAEESELDRELHRDLTKMREEGWTERYGQQQATPERLAALQATRQAGPRRPEQLTPGQRREAERINNGMLRVHRLVAGGKWTPEQGQRAIGNLRKQLNAVYALPVEHMKEPGPEKPDGVHSALAPFEDEFGNLCRFTWRDKRWQVDVVKTKAELAGDGEPTMEGLPSKLYLDLGKTAERFATERSDMGETINQEKYDQKLQELVAIAKGGLPGVVAAAGGDVRLGAPQTATPEGPGPAAIPTPKQTPRPAGVPARVHKVGTEIAGMLRAGKTGNDPQIQSLLENLGPEERSKVYELLDREGLLNKFIASSAAPTPSATATSTPAAEDIHLLERIGRAPPMLTDTPTGLATSRTPGVALDIAMGPTGAGSSGGVALDIAMGPTGAGSSGGVALDIAIAATNAGSSGDRVNMLLAKYKARTMSGVEWRELTRVAQAFVQHIESRRFAKGLK